MNSKSLLARATFLLFTVLTLFSSAQQRDILRFKMGDVLIENN